jgi:hypothetical protein
VQFHLCQLAAQQLHLSRSQARRQQAFPTLALLQLSHENLVQPRRSSPNWHVVIIAQVVLSTDVTPIVRRPRAMQKVSVVIGHSEKVGQIGEPSAPAQERHKNVSTQVPTLETIHDAEA